MPHGQTGAVVMSYMLINYKLMSVYRNYDFSILILWSNFTTENVYRFVQHFFVMWIGCFTSWCHCYLLFSVSVLKLSIQSNITIKYLGLWRVKGQKGIYYTHDTKSRHSEIYKNAKFVKHSYTSNFWSFFKLIWSWVGMWFDCAFTMFILTKQNWTQESRKFLWQNCVC